MQQKPVHINEILTILELPMNAWKLNQQPNEAAARACLNDFKLLAKKQHHMLVKRYHPDLPKNGDAEENKLKKINSIMDLIKNLKLQIRPPQPRPQVVKFVYRTGRFSGSATNSTSTSSFFSF